MQTKFSLVLALFVCCAYGLKPLSPMSFSKTGKSYDVTGVQNNECKGSNTFKEDAPGIVLAVDKYQNGCWTDGRYNHKDFSIQPGMVGSAKAYQISGYKTKAKNFQASKNTIWLSFPKQGAYKVYSLAKNTLQEIAAVTSPKANTFVKINNLLADAKPITLVVAPASTRLSAWPQLASGAEGAIVFQDSTFKVTARRWDVSVGQPHDPSKEFQRGPAYWGYRYGTAKYFFAVSNNGKEGVVWQDPKTSKIFLSWLTADFLSISHIPLPTKGLYEPVLQGAAGNGKGEVLFCAWGANTKCIHTALMCFFGMEGVGFMLASVYSKSLRSVSHILTPYQTTSMMCAGGIRNRGQWLR